VPHLFFSALQQQTILDNLLLEEQQRDTDSESSEAEETKETTEELEKIKQEDAMASNVQNTVFTTEFHEQDEIDRIEAAKKVQAEQELKTNLDKIEKKELVLDSTHVFNRAEFMALLKHYS